jgi:hypothetical protein
VRHGQESVIGSGKKRKSRSKRSVIENDLEVAAKRFGCRVGLLVKGNGVDHDHDLVTNVVSVDFDSGSDCLSVHELHESDHRTCPVHVRDHDSAIVIDVVEAVVNGTTSFDRLPCAT